MEAWAEASKALVPVEVSARVTRATIRAKAVVTKAR